MRFSTRRAEKVVRRGFPCFGLFFEVEAPMGLKDM